MIVAISYHQGDQQLMTRWANHVKQLGIYASHKLLLLPIRGVSTDGIEDVLRQCFGSVDVLACDHPERGWPVSCNKAFEQACWHSFIHTKQPFLWMEPDAVPIQPHWIDSIDLAYKQCGKPFMGDFVEISNSIEGGVDHMSGVAVYPHDCPVIAPSIFNNERVAWDVMGANEIIPRMSQTQLIQHDYVLGDKWRREVVTKDCVRPLAVIYHPDKNGVLMNDYSGGGTRAGGELRTGLGSTSFEHPPSANLHEENQKVQPQEAPQDQQAIVIERFGAILADAESDHGLKRKIKQSLIEYGWIKKAKSSKQSRKKVRSSMGKHRGARASDGIPVPSGKEVAV